MIQALVLAAAAASPAPLAASLTAGLQTLVGTAPRQTRGLQVALARGGAVIYERGFGEASIATRFPIASITKMFTAVAVMQLVQKRAVSLDATVATYLPAAPHAREITVRELLQHTSGLWNYGDYAFQAGIVSKPTTPQAILSLAATHPLTFAPGTKSGYSNTGYVVLGLIVERVSGEPLPRYEREHIFEPAGMSNTTNGNPPVGVPLAAAYISATGTPAPTFDPSWLYACGDIVSTAGDLARFDLALLNGTLLAPAAFAQMQAAPVAGEEGLAGLGLFVAHWNSLVLVGHHGGVPGYEAENEMIPSRGVAWVVLSDAFDFGTNRANRVVLAALFPGLATPASTGQAEDPAITARFRQALSSLMLGKIDRTQYADKANAALSDAALAQAAAQLKPLGEISAIGYAGNTSGAGGTLYTYRVTYSTGQTLTWQFLIDPTGKIAAIYSTG